MNKERNLLLQMVEQGFLGKSLFKYRSLKHKYTEDIFIKNELFFSSPAKFNDPFDCRIRPVISDKNKFANLIANSQNFYKKEGVKEAITNKENIDDYVAAAINKVVFKKGVCCFSQKKDDILMWSHYADCHRGICLEFDVTEDWKFFMYPIIIKYEKKYPQVDVSEYGTKFFVDKLLSTKFDDWNYEKEVRIYKEKEGSYPFRKQALKAIYFGCNANEEEIEQCILKIEENGFDNLKFYRAKMDDENYKLNFEEIEKVSMENCNDLCKN